MKRLVTLSTGGPGEACAELRVGTRSVPFLSDHGFQDVIVLPGAFLVAMARYVDGELSGRVADLVRNVTFHRPVIVGPEDTLIKIEVRDCGDGRVEYRFYEAGIGNDPAPVPVRQIAAQLEIDRNPSPPPADGADAFSIEAFEAQSQAVIDSDRFYGALRENGNHYGPSFQKVSTVWRAGHRSLGKFSVAGEHGTHDLHPIVLDAATQVLASCVIEQGKTFVLRSIGEVELAGGDLPDALWSCAVLRQEGDGDGKSFVGDVRVYSRSGKRHLALSGVAFTALDRAGSAATGAAARLVIASNFTAEPVEDSLNFWGDHFGAPLQLEFAPYDQIFQQLLDSESALRRNRSGVNVLLLGLEEWAAQDQNAGITTPGEERAERCFKNHRRYVLPNGLEIVHLNRYETDYLYREIFEDQCYLKHDIRLPDGATVVDIGANIGLFSLFVMSRCSNPRIYACEPAPVLYELLKANCEAYGTNVRAVSAGVADRPGTAMFTFYEKSSVFSGFHADEARDREAIQTVVRNTLGSETAVEGEAMEASVTELTADRLHRTTHECRLTSVSELIREHRIDKIDLLKIDAEKSEWDIVNGVEERDWPKIDQVVIEVHDPSREVVGRIEALLSAKGFRCAVEHEPLLERTGLFNLYATRDPAAAVSRASDARQSAGGLQRNVRDLCAALGAFMEQAAAPVVLCVCPRTPAAEADTGRKAALDDAERALLEWAGALPNVHTIGSASLLRRYPVKDYYDRHGHHLGHIPYTPECYAAIGTAVFRAVFNLRRKPFKVIVLDCDNTLWKGACGEEGPLGVEVSAPYRRLQEYMIGQADAGMLLCLCSRNNEQDVLDVFDQRSDMALKREHIVSWRINWNSKSDNLKSLASELELGLDSFVFLDDNPVECAEVRINCPEVLTLQLPQNSGSFATFLDHVWAFDRLGVTEEDRNRTGMYQENSERQRFRAQSSLVDFIKGLDLRVEIAAATHDQLDRLSQLTFRTNQFNFTTVRRSAREISDFLGRGQASGLAVRVADRFGDYGLVGAVLYEAQADRYRVDTLLLSCRVLGRGVEHAILSHLGRQAAMQGKRFVELAYRPTGKNAPVRAFVDSIRDRVAIESDASFIFSADRLADLEYVAEETARRRDEKPAPPGPEDGAPRPQREFGAGERWEPLQQVAERLRDIDGIAKAVADFRLGQELPRTPADVAPGGTLQASLLGIWRRVLGRPRIGIHDNFFEAGGTSLRAVQVIAMIKKELNRNLSIVSLFECPTVNLLAARLSAPGTEPGRSADTARAAGRGQRRRSFARSKAA